MAWPTTDIPTTHLDADDDAVVDARPALLQIAENMNIVRTARDQADGICPTDADRRVPVRNLPVAAHGLAYDTQGRLGHIAISAVGTLNVADNSHISRLAVDSEGHVTGAVVSTAGELELGNLLIQDVTSAAVSLSIDTADRLYTTSTEVTAGKLLFITGKAVRSSNTVLNFAHWVLSDSIRGLTASTDEQDLTAAQLGTNAIQINVFNSVAANCAHDTGPILLGRDSSHNLLLGLGTVPSGTTTVEVEVKRMGV